MCMFMFACMYMFTYMNILVCIYIQPVAFGASFNLNFQSQSLFFFPTELGKRDMEN